MRFLADGILADIGPDEQRGLGMIFFSSAPLFGPALGPVVGGLLGEEGGWRWVQGLLAILGGVCCLGLALILPETFAPTMLVRRAALLSQIKGRVHVLKLEKNRPHKSSLSTVKTALVRP
ncbi:uncharacterized protein ACLA_047950 [Aspergillus clavatus NRRL 1]|uniref:Major facilitator superfamily (MFS) profile domain-containing protein n=1 Tax=Aspergillus clavatus (strain ATCC 1007 / CBS 513.65 / DSM 816 / NCTC 3887 / NRRL 1 / QM 1276 / 107) TaxID=344612 RepID=A1CHH1_ASPCL|nr:uncharacterized protein ACLA_047950 [Aspergillus clavatus NRRL 1]EAW10326.1 hypothetical protein ACLA_047950 [Aspergillus clavatus NRRL 1]